MSVLAWLGEEVAIEPRDELKQAEPFIHYAPTSFLIVTQRTLKSVKEAIYRGKENKFDPDLPLSIRIHLGYKVNRDFTHLVHKAEVTLDKQWHECGLLLRAHGKKAPIHPLLLDSVFVRVFWPSSKLIKRENQRYAHVDIEFGEYMSIPTF